MEKKLHQVPLNSTDGAREQRSLIWLPLGFLWVARAALGLA